MCAVPPIVPSLSTLTLPRIPAPSVSSFHMLLRQINAITFSLPPPKPATWRSATQIRNAISCSTDQHSGSLPFRRKYAPRPIPSSPPPVFRLTEKQHPRSVGQLPHKRGSIRLSFCRSALAVLRVAWRSFFPCTSPPLLCFLSSFCPIFPCVHYLYPFCCVQFPETPFPPPHTTNSFCDGGCTIYPRSCLFQRVLSLVDGSLLNSFTTSPLYHVPKISSKKRDRMLQDKRVVPISSNQQTRSQQRLQHANSPSCAEAITDSLAGLCLDGHQEEGDDDEDDDNNNNPDECYSSGLLRLLDTYRSMTYGGDAD